MRLPCVESAQVLHANFFDVRTSDLAAVDVVVGNPPFIRYQRFSVDARQVALKRAAEAGVEISGLASFRAPFLVHAVRFVKAGGSLAMVVPAEVAHAGYARPILNYLCREFRTLRILTFARRLFSNLSEGTVLLLAAGRDLPFESAFLIDLPHLQSLDRCSNPVADLPPGARLDTDAILGGRERIAHYFLPNETRRLYRDLRDAASVRTLGDFAILASGMSPETTTSFIRAARLSKHTRYRKRFFNLRYAAARIWSVWGTTAETGRSTTRTAMRTNSCYSLAPRICLNLC